jgi:hypothetical protein
MPLIETHIMRLGLKMALRIICVQYMSCLHSCKTIQIFSGCRKHQTSIFIIIAKLSIQLSPELHHAVLIVNVH